MKEVEKKDAPEVSGGYIDNRRWIDPPPHVDYPAYPVTSVESDPTWIDPNKA